MEAAIATNYRAKFGYILSIGTAAFQNELHQYRHPNSKIFNGNILATFYANLMKISPVTTQLRG